MFSASEWAGLPLNPSIRSMTSISNSSHYEPHIQSSSLSFVAISRDSQETCSAILFQDNCRFSFNLIKNCSFLRRDLWLKSPFLGLGISSFRSNTDDGIELNKELLLLSAKDVCVDYLCIYNDCVGHITVLIQWPHFQDVPSIT